MPGSAASDSFVPVRHERGTGGSEALEEAGDIFVIAGQVKSQQTRRGQEDQAQVQASPTFKPMAPQLADAESGMRMGIAKTSEY